MFLSALSTRAGDRSRQPPGRAWCRACLVPGAALCRFVLLLLTRAAGPPLSGRRRGIRPVTSRGVLRREADTQQHLLFAALRPRGARRRALPPAPALLFWAASAPLPFAPTTFLGVRRAACVLSLPGAAACCLAHGHPVCPSGCLGRAVAAAPPARPRARVRRRRDDGGPWRLPASLHPYRSQGPAWNPKRRAQQPPPPTPVGPAAAAAVRDAPAGGAAPGGRAGGFRLSAAPSQEKTRALVQEGDFRGAAALTIAAFSRPCETPRVTGA